jgi:phage tail-like protein
MKSRTFAVVLVGLLLGLAAALGVLGSASKGTAAAVEPPDNAVSYYEISVDGTSVALFGELDGITSGIDPAALELRSTGAGPRLTFPARRTPPSATLRRGLTAGLELSAWHEQAMLDNAAARKNASLTMYDATGTPVARWNLANAWPAKLDISALRAGAGSVVFESVTLVADGIQRVAP